MQLRRLETGVWRSSGIEIIAMNRFTSSPGSDFEYGHLAIARVSTVSRKLDTLEVTSLYQLLEVIVGGAEEVRDQNAQRPSGSAF